MRRFPTAIAFAVIGFLILGALVAIWSFAP